MKTDITDTTIEESDAADSLGTAFGTWLI